MLSDLKVSKLGELKETKVSDVVRKTLELHPDLKINLDGDAIILVDENFAELLAEMIQGEANLLVGRKDDSVVIKVPVYKKDLDSKMVDRFKKSINEYGGILTLKNSVFRINFPENYYT